MKLCKHCKSEIDDKAKICPNCRKNQRTGCSTVLSLVLLVILLAILIPSCTGYNKKKQEDEIKTGKIESSSANINEEEAQSSESVNSDEAEEKSSGVTVGNYAENGIFKLSFESIKQYTELPDDEGFYSDKPEEGKVYIALFFEAENISSEDDHLNMFYFESYADGYAIDESFVVNSPEGYDMLSGDIATGKKMKGCKVYEVSPDWKEIEVSYQHPGKGKMTFIATPDDIT